MKKIEAALYNEAGEFDARCPVCGTDIFPIGIDEIPCEHLILAHSDCGMLDDQFYVCQDREIIERIHLELAKKEAAKWNAEPWDEFSEEEKEDAKGDVISVEILGEYLKTLEGRDDLTMITFESITGSCGGPSYPATDTLIFKTGEKKCQK